MDSWALSSSQIWPVTLEPKDKVSWQEWLLSSAAVRGVWGAPRPLRFQAIKDPAWIRVKSVCASCTITEHILVCVNLHKNPLDYKIHVHRVLVSPVLQCPQCWGQNRCQLLFVE